jgi:hypothetical protein
VLTIKGPKPAPPRPYADFVSDDDDPRLRKKKKPPTTNKIKTIIHIQRCRFWRDAGGNGAFGDVSMWAGGEGVSDIFNLIKFCFRQHEILNYMRQIFLCADYGLFVAGFDVAGRNAAANLPKNSARSRWNLGSKTDCPMIS